MVRSVRILNTVKRSAKIARSGVCIAMAKKMNSGVKRSWELDHFRPKNIPEHVHLINIPITSFGHAEAAIASNHPIGQREG